MHWNDVELPTMHWLEELSGEWIHDRNWHEGYAWKAAAIELWVGSRTNSETTSNRTDWVHRAQILFENAERLRAVAIVSALRHGASLREVAEAAGVSHMTVQRMAQRLEHADLASMAETPELDDEYLNSDGQPLPLEMRRALSLDRGWVHNTVHRMVARASPPGWLDDPANEQRAIELTRAECANHDFDGSADPERTRPHQPARKLSQKEMFELTEQPPYSTSFPNPDVGWTNTVASA